MTKILLGLLLLVAVAYCGVTENRDPGRYFERQRKRDTKLELVEVA